MLCNSTRIAPSKRRHIESMYRPARKDDPSDGSDALEWFAPLLSQPIMELFAQIPVYVLKAGGLERAVVRKAFARDLPRQIVERRSKCVTNNFLHDVFRHHEAFFRETLLDGILVRERLLDREALEAFFASAQDGHAEGFSTLIGSHIDMELWLRRWERATGARARVRSAPPVASALQE